VFISVRGQGIRLLASSVSEPVLASLRPPSRVGKSFPWQQAKAEEAARGQIVATATAAATYNKKAVILFRAGEAMADAGSSESLLRRVAWEYRVAGEYHTLLLQSGGHLVRVFE
jgi:hypothetical protein